MASSVSVHFAHANGFPAESYQQLFAHLPATWTLHAKPQFGHNPQLPVNKNWANQVEELQDYVRCNCPDGQVYGVGHSFGAVITFMAACLYPKMFKGVILIDPPLVLGPKSLLIRLAKKTAYMDKLTPAGLAQNRNTRWSKDADLVEYFKSKGLFKNMQPACVADYVKAATAVEGDHQVLTFDAQVEADIFRHLPHNLDKFKGKLRCPGLLITGQDSNVCKPEYWRRFIRHNPIAHTRVPGGHMLPLEHPLELAEKITTTIQQWEKSR
ncbi:alpha/beta fold hydrolase [Salinimonas chungwhensis]|uniref:alpha/beta fold hydrolase n=1 Tax=Salinimonas chungwhensis TaxID=265425 RepID=UPI000376C287|nr:alpha/beta hydrolase [Salinimonas chungwhensis]